MLSRADIEDFADGPLGIKPADLPAAPLPGDHAVIRERWPKWLKDDFKAMAPCAVWIGGAQDLISATVYHADGTQSRFGHNRLARPVKVGTTASWQDTVTARLDQVPFWFQGLLVRIWVRSDDHAKRLAATIVEHLSDMGELTQCRREFIDVGPDMNVEMLGQHLLTIAHRNIMDAWDDDGLVDHLTRLHRRRLEDEAKREQAKARARR